MKPWSTIKRCALTWTMAFFLIFLAGGEGVWAANGLTLSTSYPGLTVKPGETVTFTLEIENTGLPSQPVRLSTVSLPEGWTGEFQGDGRVVHQVFAKRGETETVTYKVEVPANKKTRLALGVSYHVSDQGPGDWRLIVKVDGKAIYQNDISAKTTQNGWLDMSIDLTPYAGKMINLELLNQPTDWFYEHAYWSRAEIITE